MFRGTSLKTEHVYASGRGGDILLDPVRGQEVRGTYTISRIIIHIFEVVFCMIYYVFPLCLRNDQTAISHLHTGKRAVRVWAGRKEWNGQTQPGGRIGRPARADRPRPRLHVRDVPDDREVLIHQHGAQLLLLHIQ